MTEINRDKTRKAVTEAFRLFLRKELRKPVESRIEKNKPVLYTMDTCDERPLKKKNV